MIDNPIQQIERTQDAYAGNPEGLQQRANMSKELIDLLAMQALQSDLAAQKRNMAMQQQGNPQTVKDQLEEGLMGEYRQEAAKDLGINPSEGDVVERAGIAGQQMAQNAQMPQGGGGVASQAGPVKLAGGGIVSFDAGGEVTEEQIQELNKRLGRTIDRDRAIQIIQGTQFGGLSDFLDSLKDRLPSGQQGTTRNPRGRRPAPSTAPSAGGITGPSAGSSVDDVDIPFDVNAGLALPPSMAPSQPIKPGGGVLAPQTKPGGGVMMTPEMIKEVEETVTAAKPSPAVVPPAAPTIDPDAGIKAALEKSANLDPVAQAKARSEAVKDDLGLAEGIATLGDRKGRRERAYEETTASGMDNLIDLLTAGGRGGITGVGARSGQLRREENARRMAYEDTLDGIEDKAMTLRSTIGGKAATSYDNTMKTMLTVQQGAQNSLLTLSANEQKAIREERANNLAEARNGLLREQVITGTFVDASTIGKYQTAASAALKVAIDSVDAEYATRISRAQSKVDQGEKGAEKALQDLISERAAAYENHPSYAVAVANQEQVDKFASQGATERKVQQERILAADLINKKVGT